MEPGALKEFIEKERQLRAEWDRQQRRADRGDRRLVAWLIGGILVIVIGVGFVVYRSVTLEVAARARFMRQCMEDHKEYECTALWRAGNRPIPGCHSDSHPDSDEIGSDVVVREDAGPAELRTTAANPAD